MTEPKPRVLVVDDRLEMAEMLADGLADHGYDPVPIASSRDALARLEAERVDALVTDLRMPEIDGIELLASSRRLDPQRPVIVMTAYGAIDTAIESIRQGAYHYLTKPFRLEELVIFLGRALDESRVRREAAALRVTLRERFSPEGVIAKSRAMREVLDVVERIAATDAPVLLTGETGTGKGVIARTIHGESPRASGPFVTVNCAALPESLLESELFGHVKGAFTGATHDRQGLFAEASGGTLLLDEIGEMPASLQAKLLHVLESSTVRPVGSSRERHVDVRILAATARDLRQRARAGPVSHPAGSREETTATAGGPLGDEIVPIRELQRRYAGWALERCGGHRGRTAERLGIDPKTLSKWLDTPEPGREQRDADISSSGFDTVK